MMVVASKAFLRPSGVNSYARLLAFFVKENSFSLLMESGIEFHFYYKGLCIM